MINNSHKQEFKKKLEEYLEKNNVILRIMSLYCVEDLKPYLKNYLNIIRLVLNEYDEISEKETLEEIIVPMLNFIKKYYVNRSCNSSSLSSPQYISDGVVLISLEVMLSYVEKERMRQQMFLENEIVSILFLLIMNSPSLNVKICSSRFINVLCDNEENKMYLISNAKICEYFIPLLISLYKEINILLEKLVIRTEKKDRIRLFSLYDDETKKYDNSLVDLSEGKEMVSFSCPYFSSDELISLNKISVSQLFSLLKIQIYLMDGLSRLSESENVCLMPYKLLEITHNFFNVLLKLLNVKGIEVLFVKFWCEAPIIFIFYVEVVVNCLLQNWRNKDDEFILSMIKSILDFSSRFLKSKVFEIVDNEKCVYIIYIYVKIYNIVIGEMIGDKCFNQIKLFFQETELLKWMIHIFNSWNGLFSSSSTSTLSFFLSFLPSVPLSELTNETVQMVAITIKRLCGNETPKAVCEYLKLTSFE
jgi:hypothetical protein